jgi:hypothetical protein
LILAPASTGLGIAARRGKHVAVVALARRLAGMLYALLRDETLYAPRCPAALPASTSVSPPAGRVLLLWARLLPAYG